MSIKSSDKKILLDYFDTQITMSLGTSDGKGSLWSATVYFAVDDDLNIFFMSSSDTKHSKNIEKNSKVSIAIADSNQKPEHGQIGVQIYGECKHIYGVRQIIKILSIWNKKFSKKPAPPLNQIKLDSPFYKVTPTKIKIFDSNKKEKEKVLDL